MAEQADELRGQIDTQRAEITDTVREIENRVLPSRIAARRTDMMKQRMRGWKDAVFGGSDDEWAYAGNGGNSQHGLADRASNVASSAADTIRHGPDAARRTTRGNPLAAGGIALGAGWLVAGLLPTSRRERELVRRAEPKIAEAMSTAKDEGAAIAHELREPAKQAAEEMQETAKDAAKQVAHRNESAS
jgi:hypothetical protein